MKDENMTIHKLFLIYNYISIIFVLSSSICAFMIYKYINVYTTLNDGLVFIIPIVLLISSNIIAKVLMRRIFMKECDNITKRDINVLINMISDETDTEHEQTTNIADEIIKSLYQRTKTIERRIEKTGRDGYRLIR